MAFSAVNVSNNILKRAFDEDVPVSPMKLQKILFFVAAEYAKRTHEPLLSTNFRAWRYGPVERSVYDEFRSFGAREIRAYGKDAKGKAYMADESSDPHLKAALDDVWTVAKNRSAVELSRITHLSNSAWGNAPSNGELTQELLESDNSYRPKLGLAGE